MKNGRTKILENQGFRTCRFYFIKIYMEFGYYLIGGNEEKLLASNQFLLLICKNIAGKLSAAMMRDAVSSSISERVWNYMQFKCENGILKGLEKTAFQSHCSERQLQRIMNQPILSLSLRRLFLPISGMRRIRISLQPKRRQCMIFRERRQNSVS